MKKTARNLLKRIFALTLCASLGMSMLTAVAMAAENDGEDPQVNVELILPSAASEKGDSTQQEASKKPEEYKVSEDTALPDGSEEKKDSEVENAGANENASKGDAGDLPADIQQGGKAQSTPSEIIENAAPEQDDVDAAAKQNLDDQPVDETGAQETAAQAEVQPEFVCSDKGQTSDGLEWEMTKDTATGKYTLTITFPHSEDEELNITEDNLKNIEQYAAEVSAALAAKYGSAWEWDSTAVPSGNENVNMFQVFLSGDGNADHTYRYDADKLEQMDGEFTLEKVDENGNLITDSEATFQLWHINEITDPDTSETMEVKMFCSYDAETNIYTFIPTESTIQTINGRVEILYAMMKDTVYYLQEVSAPVGYEIDPSIHIVMEKDLWEQEDESFRNQFNYLGEFTEDENGRIGLDIKFTDVKAGAGDYTATAKPTPVEAPEEAPAQVPDTVTTPDPSTTPDPAESEPTPVPDDQPNFPQDPSVVDTNTVPEPVPEPKQPVSDPAPVSENDIPKTGDALDVFLLTAAVSAMGLIAVSVVGRRKESM